MEPDHPKPLHSQNPRINRAAEQGLDVVAKRQHPTMGGGNLSGAPLSNTAPANSIDTRIKLLRSGIDSLYLSVSGVLFVTMGVHLETLKKAAQTEAYQDRPDATFECCDHRYMVSDKGSRGFRFVLSDYAHRIELSGVDSKRLPLAHIQIRSEYLTCHGVRYCCEELTKIIAEFGEAQGSLSVSRADLFCDFVSPVGLAEIDVDAFVTRARHIITHRVSRAVTGYSIAPKSPVSARLYDKTEEVKSSGKEYLKPLWHEAGWSTDLVVQRLEFQFRRASLKEHDVHGVGDLMHSLGSLWRYATLQWLKLTVPVESDKTQSRWPLHPVWRFLSEVEWDEDQGGVSIPIRHHFAPSDEKLFINGLSGVSSFMAREGIPDARIGFDEYHRQAKAFHAAREFFTGIDLNEYLLEKAANKSRIYGLEWPGSSDRADALANQAVALAYQREKQNRDPVEWRDDG